MVFSEIADISTFEFYLIHFAYIFSYLLKYVQLIHQ